MTNALMSSHAMRQDFKTSGSSPLIPLKEENLGLIAEKVGDKVAVPGFDLDKRKAGTLHFAYGAFAAAHLGVYHHEMLEKGIMDAGIIAVIPRLRINAVTGKCDAVERANALKKQNYLYTVCERDASTVNTRVIASLMDVMIGPNDRQAVYERMASPNIKQITATVTQKGYDYKFAEEDQQDQFANYLVEGLALRYERGIEPFSVMSCDNIKNNGKNLRDLVDTIAAKKSIPGFRDWIKATVPFYNTMVDRITPSISDDSREMVQYEYGIIDDEPITTETDKELVIGTFTDKPLPPFPYDLVGATYTPKVQPHELAKLTMLNGTHMFIGALGRVVGENYIDEALQKPELRSLTEIFMAQVQGTLEPLAERNYDQYAEKLMDRFRNPFQHDPLRRLARTGIDKVDTRFFAPLEKAYQKGLPHDQIVSGIAHWIVYLSRANQDQNIQADTETGFYIEDAKAYEQGYVLVAKSLNGDVSPMLSLPLFSNIKNSEYGETFRRELQDAYSAIVHPRNDNLNQPVSGGNNGPSI